jgi:sugar phosphate isomerase/epimerase
MALSIGSGYIQDHGCPEPYLRQAADAGFTHIHWCHHWGTDFLYSSAEVDQIRRWFRDFDLQMLGIHAPDGPEKSWSSSREYERLAGVELVQNRIDMAARLGTDVIVMHVLNLTDPPLNDLRWAQLLKSLDALQPYAHARGVRIALENTSEHSVTHIGQLLALYGPEYLGLCYDSGHGNLTGKGLDQLEGMKRCLIAVHLHDNNGRRDHHRVPFTGTVDWPRLAQLIATSSYRAGVSMESNTRHTRTRDEQTFLRQAYDAGIRLTHMIETLPFEPDRFAGLMDAR